MAEQKKDASTHKSKIKQDLIDFPIVGIGSSAGGLSALESLFSGLDRTISPNFSIVVVQHLAPEYDSSLSEIISNYTSLKVFKANDNMAIKINCVYIIPPGYYMEICRKKLKLTKVDPIKGHAFTIDLFFHSLAIEFKEKAFGIILSGTGTDGTIGLRAIKSNGGLAIVQKPESADFDGMPRSAISTGIVDFELIPEDMINHIKRYVTASHEHASDSFSQKSLEQLFRLLKNVVGHDFSQYKPSTIERRIKKRMAVKEINSLKEYIEYAKNNREEIEALFLNLLIGVTNFFRDKEAFKYLENVVIPQLFENKDSSSSLRIWIPGCSTGEEAYSIAILLCEYMVKANLSVDPVIFATDIDPFAIDTARRGIYHQSIREQINPEILKKYFSLESNGQFYRISKKIRDMLVFSEQNLIKDPPFSKMDLISCRNLLIYMGAELQKKVIPVFHYALNPNGYLFLGSSESIGMFDKLFKQAERNQKVFKRIDNYLENRFISLNNFLPNENTSPLQARTKKVQKEFPLKELTEQSLLQHLNHSAILVNSSGDILYLHGRTGKFLEPSPGVQGIPNVLKMARGGLHQKLPALLRKVVVSGKGLAMEELLVKTNGEYEKFDLRIVPVSEKGINKTNIQYYLIILEKSHKNYPKSHVDTKESHSDSNTIVESLQQELLANKEYLQTAQEELEAANEELKSSNEEMQSVNEELQSTNEELETSKEELQSVNEELTTVNTELQLKVNELTRLNNDMSNLLAGTGIGTIFVDFQLCIMRFTPASTKIINLINSDIGRPVNHILSNFKSYTDLIVHIKSVLDTLVQKEMEVETIDGSWYSMCIQPYRTLENVIEGAVITFVDISNSKKIENKLLKTEMRFQRFFEHSPVAINMFRLDKHGQLCLISANPATSMIVGRNPSSLMGLKFYEVYDFLSDSGIYESLINLAKGDADDSDTSFSLNYNSFKIQAFRMVEETIGFEIVNDKKGD